MAIVYILKRRSPVLGGRTCLKPMLEELMRGTCRACFTSLVASYVANGSPDLADDEYAISDFPPEGPAYTPEEEAEGLEKMAKFLKAL
jgi:hypothetical protein